MDLLEGFEILLGTYEAFLLGYKVKSAKDMLEREVPLCSELKTSFANHAHSASVKSITAGDKYLVSAGGDENVKIFNLRNRTEHGDLNHADGVINCMLFYDKKHLITASEDGNICILKTNAGWNVEKTLSKHKAGVTDLSLHPSGKLMLSIGKDAKLITWNLIKGRSAYVTNLHENADFVKWSPSGNYYLIGFFKRLDIYSVSTAAIEVSLPFPGRLNEVVFLDDVTIAVAGEMPHVEIHSIVSKSLIMKFDAHTNRVRCMALLSNQPSETDEVKDVLSHQCLVTASNDGFVKVWKLSKLPQENINVDEKTDATLNFTYDVKEEAKVDTKCRVTCLKVHKVPEVINVDTTQLKRKNKQTSEVTPDLSPNENKKSRVQISEPVIDSTENTNKSGIPKKKSKVIIEDEMIALPKDTAVQKGENINGPEKLPGSKKKKKAK